MEIPGEFLRTAFAEQLSRCADLDLFYFLVPIGFAFGVELRSLPGQASFQEIESHIADAFHIVTTSLLNTFVGIYRCVASCSSQILTILVRNMHPIGQDVLLRQPKINQVQLELFLVDAHAKVIRLDIAMQQMLGVHKLDPLDHLIHKHKHSLEAESLIALIQQVFQ